MEKTKDSFFFFFIIKNRILVRTKSYYRLHWSV